MLDLLVSIQSSIRSGIGGQIDAFAGSRDFMALAGMLPLAIVFGMAHALTPGHGKSLLAAYAVGSDLGRLRVIAVAMALTLTHIGSAVILALVANTLVTRTIVGAGQVPALHLISGFLMLAIGGWLVLRAVIGRRHVHGEGVLAGVAAGLIPCPLTLFLMFFAVSRGVPEAGLTFALAMVVGVGIVLTAVAVFSVWARQFVLKLIADRPDVLHGAVRVVDGLAGVTVVALAASTMTG
jgi:nickel/cobalt transporter (NicO) family protein